MTKRSGLPPLPLRREVHLAEEGLEAGVGAEGIERSQLSNRG